MKAQSWWRTSLEAIGVVAAVLGVLMAAWFLWPPATTSPPEAPAAPAGKPKFKAAVGPAAHFVVVPSAKSIDQLASALGSVVVRENTYGYRTGAPSRVASANSRMTHSKEQPIAEFTRHSWSAGADDSWQELPLFRMDGTIVLRMDLSANVKEDAWAEIVQKCANAPKEAWVVVELLQIRGVATALKNVKNPDYQNPNYDPTEYAAHERAVRDSTTGKKAVSTPQFAVLRLAPLDAFCTEAAGKVVAAHIKATAELQTTKGQKEAMKRSVDELQESIKQLGQKLTDRDAELARAKAEIADLQTKVPAAASADPLAPVPSGSVQP